jgi:hypothetical protein
VITFRYHVVSLVAVLLALAAGIVLGSGPLQGQVSDRLASPAGQDDEGTAATLTQLQDAQAVSDFQDAFAAMAAEQLVPQQLDGRSVLVVTLPGADAETVDAARQQVVDAGATVTGVVEVFDKLLDPGERQLAEGVSQQVLDGAPGLPTLDGLTSYGFVGTAIGRAFLTARATGDSVDGRARTISTSFEEAGFLTEVVPVQRRASLALVVTGPTDPAPVAGQDELFTQVVQGMDALANGVVVAGPPSAGDPGGLLAAVRDGEAADAVSTVDTLQVAAGRVVAVLALAEQAAGRAGHYGTADAPDGAVPRDTAAPGA